MKSSGLVAVVAAFLILPLIGGCRADSADDDAATGNSAISAADQCGDKYPEASRLFELAVKKAVQRSEDMACDDDEPEATLANIAADAHEAVSQCEAFKQVIKTSDRAAGLRDQLKGTLGYSVLIGDHTETDLVGGARLEEVLAAGVSMHSSTTIRGNTGRLDFAAGGRGSIWIDPQPGAGTFSMRWSVVAVAPDSATVTVIVEYEHEEKSFTYQFKRRWLDYYGAPNFVLELQDDRHAPGSFQMFETYPSEC